MAPFLLPTDLAALIALIILMLPAAVIWIFLMEQVLHSWISFRQEPVIFRFRYGFIQRGPAACINCLWAEALHLGYIARIHGATGRQGCMIARKQLQDIINMKYGRSRAWVARPIRPGLIWAGINWFIF